jgi:hypothetical protein
MSTNSECLVSVTPIICTPTGYYGGALSLVSDDPRTLRREAFEALEACIRDGVVKFRKYSQ